MFLICMIIICEQLHQLMVCILQTQGYCSRVVLGKESKSAEAKQCKDGSVLSCLGFREHISKILKPFSGELVQ